MTCILVAGFAPSVADAAQLHAFSENATFGSPGSGAGQLSLRAPGLFVNGAGRSFVVAPGSGVAANEESGDLYIADTENHRIDQFSSTGAFVRAFGWEVDATAPEAELQSCTVVTGCQAGSAGSAPGQLEQPIFLAVDNSCALHEPALTELTTPKCSEFDPSNGDVYVADVGDDLVTKFDSAGNLVGTWGNNGLAQAPDGQLNGSPTELFDGGFSSQILEGIAVDRSGSLWVLSHHGGMFKFDPGGAFQTSWRAEGAVGSGINGEISNSGIATTSSGDLYVGLAGNGIVKFSPAGAALGEVLSGENGGSNPSGLTLAPATDDLYVDILGSQIVDISNQCVPSHGGCLPTDTFGSPQLDEAAGLASAPDGTLYAADAGDGRIAVFAVSLEANIEAATEVGAKSAVLHGKVNPKGGKVTACSFQFGTTTSYGRNLPCLNEAGDEVGTASHPLTDSSPVALHAPLEGLRSRTAYHFRLRAASEAGEEIHSEDEELETKVLPKIGREQAGEITASSATLAAKINPEGPEVTSCRIEWGPTAEPGNPAIPYEHAEACEPAASLPPGSSAVPVSRQVSGLRPQTSYHWRVVAEDENGAETSPESTFVFLPGPPSAEVSQDCPANETLREANGSTALPDCRTYEQVTPTKKNGAVMGNFFASVPYPFALASDGSRLVGVSTQCFANSESCQALRGNLGSDFEFARTSAGWLTRPIGPPASTFIGYNLFLVAPDTGNEVFVLARPGAPPARAASELIYSRTPDGVFHPIGPVAHETLPSAFGTYTISAATEDSSHVVYQASPALPGFWPFDSTSRGSLYEYAGLADHPFLLSVTGQAESTDLIGSCGAAQGFRGQVNSVFALSSDGTTDYFTVEPCSTGAGANSGVAVPSVALYARIDGERSTARTVAISRTRLPGECGGGEAVAERACRERTSPSECGSGSGAAEVACRGAVGDPALARFVSASVDGSKVYFLSTQQLTDDASEDSRPNDNGPECSKTEGIGGCNLYLYTDPQELPLSGDHLIDVSAGDTSGQGPQVQGVIAVSPDGSHVYFVAKGLLTGKNREGYEPLEGAPNLYVYDALSAKTSFVATLSGTGDTEISQWQQIPASYANVTPDGRYLLFTSRAALTSDVTRVDGPEQVYRYDSQSESLTRVSVGSKGFNDNGNAGAGNAQIVPAHRSFQDFGGPRFANPSLSADGSRAFFESPVALVPGALNDVALSAPGVSAENVYEWEEEGKGGCEDSGGCVYLISDGKDVSEGNGGAPTAIQLIGTDQSGEDVFFTTADPLVPTDTDTGSDVYDARAGGGFPKPPEEESCSTGDACHGEGTRPGDESSPATPNFNGPDAGKNHLYGGGKKPCRKGKVRRHGHCVKRHKTRKHHKSQKSHGNRTAGHDGGGGE